MTTTAYQRNTTRSVCAISNTIDNPSGILDCMNPIRVTHHYSRDHIAA